MPIRLARLAAALGSGDRRVSGVLRSCLGGRLRVHRKDTRSASSILALSFADGPGYDASNGTSLRDHDHALASGTREQRGSRHHIVEGASDPGLPRLPTPVPLATLPTPGRIPSWNVLLLRFLAHLRCPTGSGWCR